MNYSLCRRDDSSYTFPDSNVYFCRKDYLQKPQVSSYIAEVDIKPQYSTHVISYNTEQQLVKLMHFDPHLLEVEYPHWGYFICLSTFQIGSVHIYSIACKWIVLILNLVIHIDF